MANRGRKACANFSGIMALSFTATETGAFFKARDGVKRRVLVTGAAGNIGSYFAEHSHEKYAMRLMVRAGDERGCIEQYGEVVEGDLLDLEQMKKLCAGMDTVVHLAANPSPTATWSQLLDANIVGAYNTFVAAKAAGCRRAIFASSIHAVSGYPADVQVKTTDPVNPGDLYGVTKCFGEALGRYMAEKEGLSVIALRIGAFQPREAARDERSVGMMDAFVSRRDLNQLIERCIDAENLQFAIFNGLSNNRFKRLDISDARELVGYDPQDDLTELNSKLAPLNLHEGIGAHNVMDGQKSGIREEL
jgi:NAD(P)-dependent dehydrogenase (short-subunit alcohol dehydrogenase family)